MTSSYVGNAALAMAMSALSDGVFSSGADLLVEGLATAAGIAGAEVEPTEVEAAEVEAGVTVVPSSENLEMADVAVLNEAVRDGEDFFSLSTGKSNSDFFLVSGEPTEAGVGVLSPGRLFVDLM